MYKKIKIVLMVLILSLLLVACDLSDINIDDNNGNNGNGQTNTESLRELNYENDIYYSLFVRSFADSDGDGIGDLNGVTENLDYLEELGVTALWLLPIWDGVFKLKVWYTNIYLARKAIV